MHRLAPGRSGEAAAARWVRRQSRGQSVAIGEEALGSVLPVPAQKAVYSAYPLRITASSSRL